jgi:hypothetical protein
VIVVAPSDAEQIAAHSLATSTVELLGAPVSPSAIVTVPPNQVRRSATAGARGYGRPGIDDEGETMEPGRLKAVPFFSAVSKAELAAIAQQTDEVDVPAGKLLAREGDFGDEFFLIDAGT